MGILSKIGSVVKTAVTQPVKSFTEGAKVFAAVVANPITTITKGYTAAAEKTASSSLATNITKIVTNTAAVAVPLAKPKLVVSAVKALVPSTTKGKVITAVAAPVAVGAIVSNPIQSTEAVAQTPASLVNIGSNIGEFIKEPSLEKAKIIVKENPIVSSLIGAGAALAAAPAVIAGGSTLLNTISTNQNTEALLESAANANLPKSDIVAKTSNAPVVATNPQTPQTPQTQRIVSTSANASKRRRKTPIKPQNISQRVNVMVSAGNKTYIKRTALITA